MQAYVSFLILAIQCRVVRPKLLSQIAQMQNDTTQSLLDAVRGTLYVSAIWQKFPYHGGQSQESMGF